MRQLASSADDPIEPVASPAWPGGQATTSLPGPSLQTAVRKLAQFLTSCALQNESRARCAAGFVIALLVATVPAAHAQRPVDGDVVAQHGDWQVVCKPPPPGSRNKVCALVQSVTAEDRNNVGLTVYFQKFSNGTRVLRVFAPLGILLPPGLGLKIDGKDVGNAPFLRCHTFACYAQVVVKDDLTQQLSQGKTAIFVIFQTEEAGIGIPISLSGFAKGLAALK